MPASVYHRTAAAQLALLLLLPAVGHAEFVLNFQPSTNRINGPEYLFFNCNRPRAGGSFEDCGDNDELRGNNDRDTTPFLMEIVRDPVNGERYYHTIIGLPSSDFVQEAYIKITRFLGGDDRGPVSDSLGNWTDITDGRNNAYDPLGPASFSGSGTANPKSSLFRQIINSGDVFQETIKDSYNKKPRIVQNINTPGLAGNFDLDMSNSSYDQANIAGLLKQNKQVVTQGSFSSTFDANTLPAGSNSGVNVTGGKFIYAQKYTTTLIGGPFVNEYAGEGAGYDIFAEIWKGWRDPAQNVGHLYGPDGGGD